MLVIKVPQRELWDEKKEEFIHITGGTLRLEHSLVSISKWEAKYRRSFLSSKEKNTQEVKDYIRCMSLDEEDESLFNNLTDKNIKDIIEYIEAPMTATYLREDKKGPASSEKITSELIYYWMVTLGIPFECEKWHINRLMTLIRVCAAKSKTGKHSKRDMLSSNAALNAARRARMGSKG